VRVGGDEGNDVRYPRQLKEPVVGKMMAPTNATVAVLPQQYGAPEILNSDQGSQFTSNDFTSAIKVRGIKIGMDGKGRRVDNVFVECL
jgi:transposase InsO family protein